jgi:hypothetical protein
MCCHAMDALGLPAEVIEALAQYRQLLEERGWDWGRDHIDLFRWVRFSQLGPVFDTFAATGDWAGAVRSLIGDQVPAGSVARGCTCSTWWRRTARPRWSTTGRCWSSSPCSTCGPASKAQGSSASRWSDRTAPSPRAIQRPNCGITHRWTGQPGSLPWPAAPAIPTPWTSRCWPTLHRSTSTSPASGRPGGRRTVVPGVPRHP